MRVVPNRHSGAESEVVTSAIAYSAIRNGWCNIPATQNAGLTILKHKAFDKNAAVLAAVTNHPRDQSTSIDNTLSRKGRVAEYLNRLSFGAEHITPRESGDVIEAWSHMDNGIIHRVVKVVDCFLYRCKVRRGILRTIIIYVVVDSRLC